MIVEKTGTNTRSIVDYYDWVKKQIDGVHDFSPLNLSPDFQRGNIWDDTQKRQYIESLILGVPMPPIYFNHPNWMGSFKGDFVCVDGKQRTIAIIDFVENKFSIFENREYFKMFPEIAYIGNSKYFNEIPKDVIRKTEIEYIITSIKNKKDVLRWYILLNTGGTRHTEAEIAIAKHLLNQDDN